jgi:hypothetical protein
MQRKEFEGIFALVLSFLFCDIEQRVCVTKEES